MGKGKGVRRKKSFLTSNHWLYENIWSKLYCNSVENQRDVPGPKSEKIKHQVTGSKPPRFVKK